MAEDAQARRHRLQLPDDPIVLSDDQLQMRGESRLSVVGDGAAGGEVFQVQLDRLLAQDVVAAARQQHAVRHLASYRMHELVAQAHVVERAAGAREIQDRVLGEEMIDDVLDEEGILEPGVAVRDEAQARPAGFDLGGVGALPTPARDRVEALDEGDRRALGEPIVA